MTPERQDEIERDKEIEKNREQFIKDQGLISGREMVGCRRALIVLLLGTIAMIIMFCSKHAETLTK